MEIDNNSRNLFLKEKNERRWQYYMNRFKNEYQKSGDLEVFMYYND